MSWMPGDFESHDTQKTSAIGRPPYVGVTQGGTLDKGVEAVMTLATGFQETPIDARDYAFGPVQGLAQWSKGEATGVHAEVLIIRAWIAMLVNSSATTIKGMSLQDALTALRGRNITASQPACWCCAKLMAKLGISFTGTVGKKPSTGWRHPLAKATVPNSDIPGDYSSIDDAWLDGAAKKA
jgi:hypothetical protein